MKNRGTHEHMHVCSTWEYVENQKGVINKKSTKNRPPATQGREDYMINRLNQAGPRTGNNIWQ